MAKQKSPQWLLDSINYWKDLIDEVEIGVDWADAYSHCWRCGKETKALQRCHIQPKSKGGNLDPDNIIALCSRCHDEMPNVDGDKNAVWDWIKRTCSSTYDTFWYEKALKAVGMKWEDLDLNKVLENQGRASQHFAQTSGGAILSQGTIEWIFLNSKKDSP